MGSKLSTWNVLFFFQNLMTFIIFFDIILLEFILEQISYLYDTIGATPIYASNIDRDDEAKIRKLIKY